MTAPIPFTLTNNTATVVVEGKTHTIQKGQTNFTALAQALIEGDFARVPDLLSPKAALTDYLGRLGFAVQTDGSVTETYSGFNKVVDPALVTRARAWCTEGKDPTGFLNFWKRLQHNPSMRSVEQLFTFLVHEGIPFETDGHFLAYKGVNANLTDCHSGKFDNSPGQKHSMPRNEISDDPREACHYGFHVGALRYARSFGTRTMIVRVDPENVVCVPYDHSFQKIRVCKYEVVGFDTSDEAGDPGLPNTTYEVDVDNEFDHSDADPEDEFDEDEDDLDDEEVKAPAVALSVPNLDNSRTAKDLLEHPIADLRTYASKVLKIVGASKLAGGKTALVKRILKVRSR